MIEQPFCAFGVVLAPTTVPDSATKTRPPPLGTKLVADRASPSILTGNQETDARVAMSRAVADYHAPMEFRPSGGRLVRFESAFYEWAVPEVEAAYPSVCVYANGAQTYDANGFTPHVGISPRVHLSANDFLIHTSNLTLALKIQVYASDPEERMALVAGLENAFSPVLFQSGFRLDMPHYFGARAAFLQKSLEYEDSAEDAQKRWRRATVMLEGRGPVYRIEKLPRATYKPDVRVTQGA